MRILTRIFFCTFTVLSFYSCEPEDLSDHPDNKTTVSDTEEVWATGDQWGDIDDKK